MVAILRAQPDARPIVQPEPPFLWLFHWHFKPLTPPQTFHTLVIHSASLHLSARLQPDGSHIDRTGASARSYPRPSVLRQHALVATDVAWIGAGPIRGKHDALKLRTDYAHDRCRHGDARGSEVSRCGLLQDQLIQCQVRNCTPKTLVLFL